MLARKKTQSPDDVAASNDATLSHLYFAACSFLLQTRLLRLSHAVTPIAITRLHASSPRTHRRRRSHSVSGSRGPFPLGSAGRDDRRIYKKVNVRTLGHNTRCRQSAAGRRRPSASSGTRVSADTVLKKKKWSKCSSDVIYGAWWCICLRKVFLWREPRSSRRSPSGTLCIVILFWVRTERIQKPTASQARAAVLPLNCPMKSNCIILGKWKKTPVFSCAEELWWFKGVNVLWNGSAKFQKVYTSKIKKKKSNILLISCFAICSRMPLVSPRYDAVFLCCCFCLMGSLVPSRVGWT